MVDVFYPTSYCFGSTQIGQFVTGVLGSRSLEGSIACIVIGVQQDTFRLSIHRLVNTFIFTEMHFMLLCSKHAFTDDIVNLLKNAAFLLQA
jgi:hypothetical protein